MNVKKYYICEKCGNIVEVVSASGVNIKCCGGDMTELKAGVVEASHEKHIPVVSVDGDTVNVVIGSVEHPMSAEHSILWVSVETDKGTHRKYLEVGAEPRVSFKLADEKPVAVYAYCNLHGLWKTEL